MNRHLSIFGIAVSILLMTGCTEDGTLAVPVPGSESGGNAKAIPILLASSAHTVTRGLTAAGLSQGGIGVFCLADGRADGTAGTVRWTPSDGSTVCLDNAEALSASTTEAGLASSYIDWADGQTRFYPESNSYTYNFYSYYPYSEGGSSVTADAVTVDIRGLDGQKEVVWAKSDKPSAGDSHASKAYSAAYYRAMADESLTAMLPSFAYERCLVQLTVTVPDEVQAQSVSMQDMPTTGTLIVASADDGTEGQFAADWNNSLTTYTADVTDGTATFFVPLPAADGSYRIVLTYTTDGSAVAESTVYTVPAPDGGWQSGHRYDIILTYNSVTTE